MNRRIGVILSYILMIFEVLSTLLLTPFIIRMLGQAEYGVYKLVAAINAYLLLLDLGVGNAITRYVAKFRVEDNETQGRRFLGIATIYYIVIAVVAAIVGVVFVAIFPGVFAKGLSSQEAQMGQKILCITMINSTFTLGTAAYNNVLIAYERFAISRGSSIIQIIVRMAMTYIALKMGFGSVGLVSVNLMCTVLCRGFFVFYVLFGIKLRPLYRGIEISFVKEIVIYSTWILLQMIATQLNSTVDQVLLGALVTSSAVIIGVYGVGTQIVQYFQSIGSAFTGVLMPGIVKMVEKKVSAKEITDEMIRIGRIIFMVLAMIWGGFLVFGRDFIFLWAGKENTEAYYVALILMTAYVFILTESIGTQILWAMNEHKEQAMLKLVIVLLNILLTILLIKWEPLLGATIGTFVSLMLGDVGVMNLIFRKKLGMNLGYYYKGLMKGIIPCLFLTVGAGILISFCSLQGWIGFGIEIAVMVVVYCVSMLAFGMNQYEKELVVSVVNKVIRRYKNSFVK